MGTYIPPYCDYCGEVINNFHKVEDGQDLFIALTKKQFRKDDLKKKRLTEKMLICCLYILFPLWDLKVQSAKNNGNTFVCLIPQYTLQFRKQ